jgi:hypothetical protein
MSTAARGLVELTAVLPAPKLDARHKAFLARLVEEGPIPAIHGVVRLYEEFGLSVSDDSTHPVKAALRR